MDERLEDIAAAMVADGKGILAADESSGTIKKRFDTIGLELTADARRDYREMLFSTDEAMKKYISGVILYDETLRQKAKDGTPLVDMIKAAGSVPGIKVDSGAKPLAGYPGETITEGLDGLRDKLAEYYKLGARFAKWRGVISISYGLPSWGAVKQNAQALARYAALCQEAGIVPIVEPEVLMDGEPGDHSIGRCHEVTEWVLRTVFNELHDARVRLEGMVLKPNMVIDGKKARTASQEEVAEKTLRVPEGNSPHRCPRHSLPFRRPVGRGSDGASFSDERRRSAALEAHLLVRPGAAGSSHQGLERQGGERCRRPARFPASRAHERSRRERKVATVSGKGSLIRIQTKPRRAQPGGAFSFELAGLEQSPETGTVRLAPSLCLCIGLIRNPRRTFRSDAVRSGDVAAASPSHLARLPDLCLAGAWRAAAHRAHVAGAGAGPSSR